LVILFVEKFGLYPMNIQKWSNKEIRRYTHGSLAFREISLTVTLPDFSLISIPLYNDLDFHY